MIVMHHPKPKVTYASAIGTPAKMIHTILAKKEGMPPPYVTLSPKGASESRAILKHWRPKGIQIIVM